MKRGFSPGATAAFVTTLVVLGLVGWSIGWLAAGTDLKSQGDADRTPSASPTPSRSPSKAPSPTPLPTGTPTRTDYFAMPNLVGKKFRDARQDAIKLKLGVTVEFDEPSGRPAGTVVKTFPEEKFWVWPGLQIILYVAGPAPKVAVPAVAGKTCEEGKDELVLAGLRIESYPTGNKGKVVKTDPAALTQVTWNEQVKVYCAQPSASQ